MANEQAKGPAVTSNQQELGQLVKKLQVDHSGGFNSLDILMALSKGEKKIIGVDAPLAHINEQLGDIAKSRSEQTTTLQHFQDDANKIIAKKPNQAITDALQVVRTELNNLTVKHEKLKQYTTDLIAKLRTFTSARTSGTMNPTDLATTKKELEDGIAKARQQLKDLRDNQKHLFAELSNSGPLFRIIESSAADLGMATTSKQYLQQQKTASRSLN